MIYMKRKTRRILFAVSFLLFLVFGYVAILYAQGYKYSFQDHRFVRTGAISLKVNTDAKVYLDDKLAGSTSFLSNSFSRGGLVPHQHTVRVTQEGYTTWQKKALVQEGYLIDFPRVLILPENEEARAELIAEIESLLYPSPLPSPAPTESLKLTPKPSKTIMTATTLSVNTDPYYVKNKVLYKNSVEPEILAQNVLGFSISRDQSKIVWFTTNNELWLMWLEDSNYQPYHKLNDKELITRFSTKIKNIGWFKDNDHVAIDSLGYKIVETDTRGGINIIKL